MIKKHYYSDLLNKYFPTEKEAEEAEKIHLDALEKLNKEREEKKQREEALKLEREARANEVNKAFDAAREANIEANRLLSEFIKDYGRFHRTFNSVSKFFFDIF